MIIKRLEQSILDPNKQPRGIIHPIQREENVPKILHRYVRIVIDKIELTPI